MKAVIAFLFMLLSFSAQAQQFDCMPSNVPLGKGTEAQIFRADAGWGAGWYCPGKFQWVLQVATAHDTWLKDGYTKGLQAFKAADPATAFKALLMGYPPKTDVEWITDQMPPRPDNPVWVVANNGAYTTRPTYFLRDNELVAAPDRVDVQTTVCDCVTYKPVDGRSVYCSAKTKVVGTDTVPLYAVCTLSQGIK